MVQMNKHNPKNEGQITTEEIRAVHVILLRACLKLKELGYLEELDLETDGKTSLDGWFMFYNYNKKWHSEAVMSLANRVLNVINNSK